MQTEFLPLDCTFRDREDDTGTPNSIAALWYRISFPLVAMVSYVLIVATFKLRRTKKNESENVKSAPASMRLVFFVVFLALCIDLVSNLLAALSCLDLASDYSKDHRYSKFEDLDLVSVWMEDTSVTCWREEHLVSAVFAGMGLFLCVAVLVLMVLVLRRGSKANRLDDPEFVGRFGVLYLGYRLEGVALYWESVITGRKMLMAGAEVYAQYRETSGVEVGLLALVVFASLALQDIFQPFKDEDGPTFPSYAGSEVRLVVPESWRCRWARFNAAVTMNGLEKASLFVSLSLFLVAGCITDKNANAVGASVLLSLCFVANALFFFFVLYRLWYGVHHYLDILADDKNISFAGTGEIVDEWEDRETYMISKVWVLMKFKWKERAEAGSTIGSV